MINPQSVNQDINRRSEILEMNNIKLVFLGSVSLKFYPGLGTRSLFNSFLTAHCVVILLALSWRLRSECGFALGTLSERWRMRSQESRQPFEFIMGPRRTRNTVQLRVSQLTRVSANHHWLKWNKSNDMQGTWSRSKTLTPPEKRPVCLWVLDTLEELFPCQNIHMPLTWVTDGMEFVSISGTTNTVSCGLQAHGQVLQAWGPKSGICLLPCGVNMCYHV